MTQDVGVASIPDAWLAEMERYVNAAKATRTALLTPDHFALAPSVFKMLGRNGARPAALFGVPVREYSGWSWGWALFVRNIYSGITQFEPVEAVRQDAPNPLGETNHDK